MRFTDDSLRELKNRFDLREYVRQHGHHPKAGAAGRPFFKICCPFHNEKTPSCDIRADRFYCHGCGANGDSIKFVMDHHGLDFPSAVETSADFAGVRMEKADDRSEEEKLIQRDQAEKRRRYEEMYRAAQEFYAHCLDEEPRAQEYLQARGITRRSARHFGLGVAPSGKRQLLSHLEKLDFAPMEVVEMGLGRLFGDGEIRDAFFNRIMFPVKAMRRKSAPVIGFSGRIYLPEDKSPNKYKNTGTTEFYTKRNHLFGFPDNFEGNRGIRKKGSAILVEGNFDVAILRANEICNAAAILGTALTSEQVALLCKHCSDVTLMFDGDKSGRSAAEKALFLFAPVALKAHIVPMPDGEDPDSMLRRLGRRGFVEHLVENRVGLERWFFGRQFPRDLDPSERSAGIQRCIEVISLMPDQIVAEDWCREIAAMSGVRLELVLERLHRRRGQGASISSEASTHRKPAPPAPTPKPEGLEEPEPTPQPQEVSNAPLPAFPQPEEGQETGGLSRLSRLILTELIRDADHTEQWIEELKKNGWFSAMEENLMELMHEAFERIEAERELDWEEIARSLVRDHGLDTSLIRAVREVQNEAPRAKVEDINDLLDLLQMEITNLRMRDFLSRVDDPSSGFDELDEILSALDDDQDLS